MAFSLHICTCRQPEKKFDLYYYDGLANQDKPIILTIGEFVETSWCDVVLQYQPLYGTETD